MVEGPEAPPSVEPILVLGLGCSLKMGFGPHPFSSWLLLGNILTCLLIVVECLKSNHLGNGAKEIPSYPRSLRSLASDFGPLKVSSFFPLGMLHQQGLPAWVFG